MKLHDFLTTAGGATPAPSKPVRFRIVGKNHGDDGALITAEANAVLVCVSEHERQQALRAALAEIRKQFPHAEPPDNRLSDEETYHILHLALRDSDDPRVGFAGTVAELRTALTVQVARDLFLSFSEFMEDEFPQVIDKKEFESMAKEAESKSLAVLLSSFDYSKIRRALPGLAVLYGK